MQLDKGIIFFATDEARKEYERKEPTKKNKKSSCPQCEITEIKKKINDEIILKEEDL
jgi:hypothetical protein